MATIKQMEKFVAALPKDAQVVVVTHCNKLNTILMTDNMVENREDGEFEDSPNWARAVWEGIAIANKAMPDPDDATVFDDGMPNPQGRDPGNT